MYLLIWRRASAVSVQPEINHENPGLVLSILFLRRSLPDPEVHPSISASQCWDKGTHHHVWSYMCAGGPNSVPHIWAARTQPTKPFLKPPLVCIKQTMTKPCMAYFDIYQDNSCKSIKKGLNQFSTDVIHLHNSLWKSGHLVFSCDLRDKCILISSMTSKQTFQAFNKCYFQMM